MPEEIIYTVGQANELLPWVGDKLAEGARAVDGLARAQQEAKELQGLSRSNGHGDIDARLKEARTAVSRESETVRRVVREISEKGIEVRDFYSGLIDFPGERDGRRVWLCWKRGEPEVGFWHETDTGFTGRQAL